MRRLLHSAGYLVQDVASMILFVVVLDLTHRLPLAIGLGMALGAGQIGWRLIRRSPIDPLQWMSVALVLVGGTASLLTKDPRFVMLKPTVINGVVGCFMLRRGWSLRYLPAIALDLVSDVAIVFGYVWAAMMLATGVLNIVLALTLDPLTWGKAMSVVGIASMTGLFLVQYAVMRAIAVRRARRRALAATAAVA